MDRSEVYVKMCKKAIKIQEEWNRDWDHDYWETTSLPPFLVETWLPLQDQLQKLDGRHWREFDQACEYEWSLLPNIEKDISTKEQCGIRVVMRKFNKVWNGEEWVDENQTKDFQKIDQK